MEKIKFNLTDLLNDVVKSDTDVDYFLSGEFAERVFGYGVDYVPSPTDDEKNRVVALCGDTYGDDEIERIWDDAVTNHYLCTYVDEYMKAVKNALEEKTCESFKDLTYFFEDELKDMGITNLQPLKICIDWKNDEAIIEGDLQLLDGILYELVEAYGWSYGSLEEFQNAYPNMENRIRGHIHYLKEIEKIYGTGFDFFTVELSDLDYYGTFGEFDATDEEILEAVNYI